MAEHVYEVTYSQHFTKSVQVVASSQKEAIAKAKVGDALSGMGIDHGPQGAERNWTAELYEEDPAQHFTRDYRGRIFSHVVSDRTGHTWPCTRFYLTSTERDECTCGKEPTPSSGDPA
jgi:hypothetical protein